MSDEARLRGRFVFDEAPQLYQRVRPIYPAELFEHLTTLTGLDDTTRVLEIGCGTGQATHALAALAKTVTAIEPGPGLAALARAGLAGSANVAVETASFEDWDDGGRTFDLIVAASSWHWVDPMIGWRRAHDLLAPGGALAILGHVVIRRPGVPEAYAETADLHERFAPGNPSWGHPPTEADVRASGSGWGPPNVDHDGHFGPVEVRWRPTVQLFDAAGFADHLRSQSIYRRLDEHVRERLLGAVEERLRRTMADRVERHFLSVLRVGVRSDRPRRSRADRRGKGPSDPVAEGDRERETSSRRHKTCTYPRGL